MAVLSLTTANLFAYPLVSELFNNINHNNKSSNKMKKIVIINGGPRKNMNTAAMTESFRKGVNSSDKNIEVKEYWLYDLDQYKGCISCMACKIKGKSSRVCKYKDALLPVLHEASEADGLVLASPIYMGDRTAMLQAFVERIVFPWLSYADGSIMAIKKMPVVFIYTMNASSEQAPIIHKQLELSEQMFGIALGQCERIEAFNTYQMKDYSRFEFAEGTAEAKQTYKDTHWENDLQNSFDAGKRMAEKIS